jgi:peptide deformylase
MNIPELVPIYRSSIEKFDFDNPQTSPIELAHVLAQAVIKYDGLGVSANQLGLPYRAFAIKAEKIIVCFNPFLLDVSEETVYLEESCLSFPNLYVKIKRPRTIKVRYTEPNGNVVTCKFDGMTARVFLHELDHLNGIVHLTHAHQVHVQQAKTRAKKISRMKK